jgi:hypothetical protein
VLSFIFAPAIKAISMGEKKSGNGRLGAVVCVGERARACAKNAEPSAALIPILTSYSSTDLHIEPAVHESKSNQNHIKTTARVKSNQLPPPPPRTSALFP